MFIPSREPPFFKKKMFAFIKKSSFSAVPVQASFRLSKTLRYQLQTRNTLGEFDKKEARRGA